MTIGAAIQRAICDEPTEVLHRLVYADWLEENGTGDRDAARAELIRVQIAREASPLDSDSLWSLRAQERVLLTTWGDALAEGVREHVADFRYQRGFVEAAALTVDALLEHGPDLRAVTPLRAVALEGQGEQLTPAAIAPYHGLRLWSVLRTVTDTAAQRDLAAAANVRVFDLSPLWWEFLLALLERGQPLEHLGLGSVGIPGTERIPHVLSVEADDLAQLLERPVPPTLRSLDLRGLATDRATLATLFATPWLHQAERLFLWTRHQPEDLAPIDHEEFARLRSLWVGGDLAGWVGLVGRALPGLRNLVVQGADWQPEHSLTTLLNLRVPGLESLRIEYADASPLVGALAVDRWQKLRRLEFHRWDRSYHAALPGLLAAPCVRRLRRLEIPGFPEVGFPREVGVLPLAELTVTAVDIGAPLGAIARSLALANLTALEVARVRIDGPRDLEPLLDHARFPRLLRLHLGGIALDATWRHRFADRFGAGAVLSTEPVRAFAIHDRIGEGEQP